MLLPDIFKNDIQVKLPFKIILLEEIYKEELIEVELLNNILLKLFH